MKVIFFGLGSIARRHITCLQALAPDAEIHAYRIVRNSPPPPGITDIYRLSEVARGAYDIAFITTPTRLHIGTATFAATLGIPNLFIEKPLGVTTDGLAQLLAAVKENKTSTYIAYPFRHHSLFSNPTQYRPVYYFIRCHTDLKRWNNGEVSDYSKHVSTGGGVILELSHELDLATHLFGDFTWYQLLTGYDDGGFPELAVLYLSHKNNSGSMRLELRGTFPTERYIEVSGEKIRYEATDDMYLRQMQYFLSNLGNRHMTNNVHSALPLFRVLADLHQQSIKRTKHP